MTSPWESAERVEHIRALAGRGEPAALLGALTQADAWTDGFGVVTLLRGLPESDRAVLAGMCAREARSAEHGPAVRERALVLLAAVSGGFAEHAWCAAWEDLLAGMARRWWSSGLSDDMWTLAHALLDADRPLAADVVRLLRCSAREHGWPSECTDLVLDRVPGPVLSPGEPWSDRLLADLPGLGEPWPGLIEHALRTRQGRPTRTWERGLLELAAPVGPDDIRRTVTPWLHLASAGGGRPDGAFDPYNLPALLGLIRLLTLRAPHPDAAPTLAALVELPPLHTALTSAAVRALGDLPDRAGHGELRRLAGPVSHRTTQRQIQAALDGA